MTMHTSYVTRQDWRDASVEVWNAGEMDLNCPRCDGVIRVRGQSIINSATLGELVDAAAEHLANECRGR